VVHIAVMVADMATITVAGASSTRTILVVVADAVLVDATTTITPVLHAKCIRSLIILQISAGIGSMKIMCLRIGTQLLQHMLSMTTIGTPIPVLLTLSHELAISDKYTGNDQIHTASGSGMNIKHIGYSTIHTPSYQLMLNKILHVPQATKNLIYVHRLASDNNVFLEFHPHFFCIKDLDTRNMLVKGLCQGGLYPLPTSFFKKLAFGVNKLACGVVKPSIDRWHSHLGHPAIPIVQRVIRNFNCLV
jgi:hypothetical protein